MQDIKKQNFSAAAEANVCFFHGNPCFSQLIHAFIASARQKQRCGILIYVSKIFSGKKTALLSIGVRYASSLTQTAYRPLGGSPDPSLPAFRNAAEFFGFSPEIPRINVKEKFLSLIRVCFQIIFLFFLGEMISPKPPHCTVFA